MTKTITGDQLAALGLALYGEAWQGPLARALGVNPRLVARLRSGREEIGEALRARLADLAAEERRQALAKAEAIGRIVGAAGLLSSSSEFFPANSAKRRAPGRT